MCIFDIRAWACEFQDKDADDEKKKMLCLFSYFCRKTENKRKEYKKN